MASFDENGKYIKTNWKAGDKITAVKLNKIEESIETVNDNDISRHVEADARLDALEAKDVTHDKELTDIKNAIADNKAASELGDYDINSRMTFLENEFNEGIEEVYNVANTVDGKIAQAVSNVNNVASTVDGKINAAVTNVNNVASTVDGKIAEAEANMTAQVNQGKVDMEAMVAGVESEMNVLQNDVKTCMSWKTDIGQDENLSKNYYILPGGLMIQYGMVFFSANTVNATHDFTLELPKPCNAYNSVFLCSLSGAEEGWDGICSGHFTSSSYVRIVIRNMNNNVANTLYWIALSTTNEVTINEEIID